MYIREDIFFNCNHHLTITPTSIHSSNNQTIFFNLHPHQSANMLASKIVAPLTVVLSVLVSQATARWCWAGAIKCEYASGSKFFCLFETSSPPLNQNANFISTDHCYQTCSDCVCPLTHEGMLKYLFLQLLCNEPIHGSKMIKYPEMRESCFRSIEAFRYFHVIRKGIAE